MDSLTDTAADVAQRPADLEAVLMGAVDQARAALAEFSGPDTIGEYLGASFEDPTSATHRFLADMPGYRGWQWAVVVAAYPGAEQATISELVLVPGPTALLAPSGCPGRTGCVRATSAPATCSRHRARIPGWCPATSPPVIRRSTRPPQKWGLAAGRC